MNEQIPELKVERMNDGQGTLILLEQDNSGNSETVALHPIHLRFLAEQFGLVPTSDPEGAKTIATLQRRLRLLRDRLEHMRIRLAAPGEKDPGYDSAYLHATSIMADEFCREAGEQA